MIYFANVNHAGSWHDSQTIQDSDLWTSFEVEGRRPFPGAVILGDIAYIETSWLIPPFRGDHTRDSPKDKFNQSHRRTRSVVERAIGNKFFN